MMRNVRKILDFLASLERDEDGKSGKTCKEINEALDIILYDVKDSIEIAKNRGWVKYYLVTGKEEASVVAITPEGRLWIDQE